MKRASCTSHVANVPATAPVARLQIVQWQCVTRRCGPSASKRTAPHKQEPVTFLDASIKPSSRFGDEHVPHPDARSLNHSDPGLRSVTSFATGRGFAG